MWLWRGNWTFPPPHLQCTAGTHPPQPAESLGPPCPAEVSHQRDQSVIQSRVLSEHVCQGSICLGIRQADAGFCGYISGGHFYLPASSACTTPGRRRTTHTPPIGYGHHPQWETVWICPLSPKTPPLPELSSTEGRTTRSWTFRVRVPHRLLSGNR